MTQQQKKCEQCGRMFKPKQFYQRFHSKKCRNLYHSKLRAVALATVRKEKEGAFR